MIVISVILAVTASFLIYTLIKVIDKRREILSISMERQSRLSLKRNRYQENVTNKVSELVEISDDESSDSLTNLQSNIEEVNCESTTSGMAYISNAAKDSLNPVCSLTHTHDLSDDLSSSNDDVVVIDVPNTPKNNGSMFNWKDSFASMSKSQSSMSSVQILHDSRLEKEREMSTKKQKLFDLTSSYDDDDDLDVMGLNNIKEKASPPKVTIQHDIMIAGTKVTLPVKPYPCQKAVMNSLIKGCAKEEHCLLESPTGSGKTLALLCGALAWQQQYSENLQKEDSGIDAANSCSCDEDLDDNFFLNSSQYFDEEWCDKVLHKAKSRKVPKIYYGTRTHRQIEQVVRELKKTVYKHKRMTILSSRKVTCIQNTNRNKDELCHELLDPLKLNTCPYYNEQSKKKMNWFGELARPWDVEDLVSLGKEIGTCPYFGARSLMAQAEIIFCPYNYIVDPKIRESMQINLKGDIVILDEAHNIENICRDAASVILRDDEIECAVDDCKDISRKLSSHNGEIYLTIHRYLTDIVKFLETINVKENVNSYWLGAEFLALLDMNNVGRSRFPDFHNASKMAIQDFEKAKQEQLSRTDKTFHIISRETKNILEYLCFAIQMLTSDVSVNDYRVCVIESMVPSKKKIPENTWISTKKKKGPVRVMQLLCMNPAIIFAPLARTVRSVILASGTLTPITSFQSELGTKFSHIVNPDHIISKDQVYVRCIPRGPNGQTLVATFQNVAAYIFQDELGSLILQVCDAVPHGVLCFFSSYAVMNKLFNRWETNGTWNKLRELKQIFVEPRNNEDLAAIMKDYRNAIQKSSSKSINEASGAILFAVFRGKVAEGIDFSDNEARCVLVVGIPYKNQTDIAVDMKKKYNDSNKSKGFLSGSEWYTVDAFRALNQALGRCIRHKDDWGAVLLVDERYQEPRRLNYLPKWVRTKWLHDRNYDLQTELEDFVAIQVAREREKKCVTAV
ncbi:Fanconi anemia group J protein homolog [Nylanderia fulva]|uniref:Fanconi anemia group J protein homolog n=1 Tax=Nylanderia fulva TaxID=613905 RepID=UPI0010FB40FA|nr:Fanconi anemia group J protein homolog [Nylanderia fulva]